MEELRAQVATLTTDRDTSLATERERADSADELADHLLDSLSALDAQFTRADAAEADRDYWREQATGMAPSVDGMRVLCTRLFPGGTGCVVEPDRVVAEVERLRARVIDAEAEASRWGDALVAIGEAIGMPGRGSAEIVEGVRNLTSLLADIRHAMSEEFNPLDDKPPHVQITAEWARAWAAELERRVKP